MNFELKRTTAAPGSSRSNVESERRVARAYIYLIMLLCLLIGVVLLVQQQPYRLKKQEQTAEANSRFVTNERFRARGGFCNLIEGDSEVIALCFLPAMSTYIKGSTNTTPSMYGQFCAYSVTEKRWTAS